jgi:hypothetical protein
MDLYTLIVLSIQLVSAKAVTGVVSDAVGSLPGVNLIVKGTKEVHKPTLMVNIVCKRRQYVYSFLMQE